MTLISELAAMYRAVDSAHELRLARREVKHAHQVIAALAKRAGGTLTVSADELMAVSKGELFEVFDAMVYTLDGKDLVIRYQEAE